MNSVYADIITSGMVVFNRLKFEHLMTNSYSAHVLYEKTADSLMELIDSFAEVAIGECANMDTCVDELSRSSFEIDMGVPIETLIQAFIGMLGIDLQSAALRTICDDMRILLSRFRYLHRLK